MSDSDSDMICTINDEIPKVFTWLHDLASFTCHSYCEHTADPLLLCIFNLLVSEQTSYSCFHSTKLCRFYESLCSYFQTERKSELDETCYSQCRMVFVFVTRQVGILAIDVSLLTFTVQWCVRWGAGAVALCRVVGIRDSALLSW